MEVFAVKKIPKDAYAEPSTLVKNYSNITLALQCVQSQTNSDVFTIIITNRKNKDDLHICRFDTEKNLVHISHNKNCKNIACQYRDLQKYQMQSP